MKNPEVSELLLVSSNFLEDRVNNNEIRGEHKEKLFAYCVVLLLRGTNLYVFIVNNGSILNQFIFTDHNRGAA